MDKLLKYKAMPPKKGCVLKKKKKKTTITNTLKLDCKLHLLLYNKQLELLYSFAKQRFL